MTVTTAVGEHDAVGQGSYFLIIAENNNTIDYCKMSGLCGVLDPQGEQPQELL